MPATVEHAAFEMVQLAERARDWPGTLSGGQRQQRGSLARRRWSRRPPLLLLDEPLGAARRGFNAHRNAAN